MYHIQMLAKMKQEEIERVARDAWKFQDLKPARIFKPLSLPKFFKKQECCCSAC